MSHGVILYVTLKIHQGGPYSAFSWLSRNTVHYDGKTQFLGAWFRSRLGGVGLTVGLSGLKGLFQQNDCTIL